MNYNKIVENNSKYLVCECDENKKSYTYKMLQNNNIDSLIKPVERNINGESFLYYKTAIGPWRKSLTTGNVLYGIRI